MEAEKMLIKYSHISLNALVSKVCLFVSRKLIINHELLSA